MFFFGGITNMKLWCLTEIIINVLFSEGLLNLLLDLLLLLLGVFFLRCWYLDRVQMSWSILFDVLFDLFLVGFWVVHQQTSGLTIQGVLGIRIQQKLWEENWEDVDELIHGWPRLIDYIEAYTSRGFVYIWMVYAVSEANWGTFKWILLWQDNSDFPLTPFIWALGGSIKHDFHFARIKFICQLDLKLWDQ